MAGSFFLFVLFKLYSPRAVNSKASWEKRFEEETTMTWPCVRATVLCRTVCFFWPTSLMFYDANKVGRCSPVSFFTLLVWIILTLIYLFLLASQFDFGLSHLLGRLCWNKLLATVNCWAVDNPRIRRMKKNISIMAPGRQTKQPIPRVFKLQWFKGLMNTIYAHEQFIGPDTGGEFYSLISEVDCSCEGRLCTDPQSDIKGRREISDFFCCFNSPV